MSDKPSEKNVLERGEPAENNEDDEASDRGEETSNKNIRVSSNVKESPVSQDKPRRRSKRTRESEPQEVGVLCEDCGVGFDTQDELLEHSLKEHIELVTEREEKDQQNEFAKYHKRGKRPFNCSYCFSAFPSNEMLLNHRQRWHSEAAQFDNEDAVEEETVLDTETREEEQDQKNYALNCSERKKRLLCTDCFMSFSSHLVLLHHKIKWHEDEDQLYNVIPAENDGMLHDDATCEDFGENDVLQTSQLDLTPKLEKEKEVKPSASRKLSTPVEDKPTSTRLANVTLAVSCPHCVQTFATNAEMMNHKHQMHKDIEQERKRKTDDATKNKAVTDVESKVKVSFSDYPNCPECGKAFFTADFLDKHMALVHKPVEVNFPCGNCGEVFKSNMELVTHENSCFAPPDEPHTKNGNVIASSIADVFADSAPPPAKKLLLDDSASEVPETQSIPPEASANPDLNLTPEKVIKEEVEDSSHSDSKPDDRIQKSDLPLSAAIYVRSKQYPDELMVVWSDQLEDDLLEAVKLNPAHSIMCIKELDTVNLTDKQKEVLFKSDWFTMRLCTGDDTYTPWTVICFTGNIPVVLVNGKFRNFFDVERNFIKHAEDRGKSIHHVMKNSEKGVFPQLSQQFIKNITAFK